MDVYFVLNGVTFVWNDEKARITSQKHDGVTFQQSTEAFFAPFLVVVVLVAMMKREMLSSV